MAGGRPGPPPKPTHLKLLTGNPGGKRLNRHEPKPPIGIPRCPEWLSSEAKEAWKRVAPKLRVMGLLTLADGEALTGYAETFALWKQCTEFITKNGVAYPMRDERGRVRCMQQFPQVAVARNCLLILKGYQQEFGLTPAARSRIQLPGDPDGSEEDEATSIIGY